MQSDSNFISYNWLSFLITVHLKDHQGEQICYLLCKTFLFEMTSFLFIVLQSLSPFLLHQFPHAWRAMWFLQHSKRGLRSDWVSLGIFRGLLSVAFKVPVVPVSLAWSPVAEVYKLSPSSTFSLPSQDLVVLSTDSVSPLFPGAAYFNKDLTLINFFSLSFIFSLVSLLSVFAPVFVSLIWQPWTTQLPTYN